MEPFTFDFARDLALIEEYNARRTATATTRIRTEIAPAAYEGRIGSPLTWLLSNPSYDPHPGYLFNHPPRPVEGWAFQSLAPEHRDGYGKWAWDRLRELREAAGDQKVSNNVLAVQISPWASEDFDAALRLPSRDLARRIVLHQIRVGSVIVMIRSATAWVDLVPELGSIDVVRGSSPRSAWLSRGNLKARWDRVLEAVATSPFT